VGKKRQEKIGTSCVRFDDLGTRNSPDRQPDPNGLKRSGQAPIILIVREGGGQQLAGAKRIVGDCPPRSWTDDG
jgi:hypothetical protein